MDTLSSMANIGGYKGVLLAAVELNRYFPMLTTAAGMVVSGEGVRHRRRRGRPAGHRHGPPLAPTFVATDVRPEVKEQIESVARSTWESS